MTQDLSARLRRVEQQIRAFRELHSSELQLILDELTDIAEQVEAQKAAESAPAASIDPSDPAAASPKRAKWLAEQERRAAPRSRRELLFGGDKET
ncbi:MAG: hypothetical protein WEE03_07885 [Chloroflexota bacterium]|nr:hypothetical protein [Candidatus Limnocylindria bacterium]